MEVGAASGGFFEMSPFEGGLDITAGGVAFTAAISATLG